MLRFWEENRIFDKLRAQNRRRPALVFPRRTDHGQQSHGRAPRLGPVAQGHVPALSRHERPARCATRTASIARACGSKSKSKKVSGCRTKREIRDYGIEKFVRACKERVLTYAARQTEQSIRLGYWCDWDDPKRLDAAPRCTGGRRSRRHREASQRAHRNRARQRNYPQARFAGIRRQLLHLLRREQLHHLGVSQEVPRARASSIAATTSCRGAAAAAPAFRRWKWPKAAASPRTPRSSCASRFSGQEKTALLVWTTTPWTLYLQRRGGGQSGDDLSEGPPWRLDLLRRQRRISSTIACRICRWKASTRLTSCLPSAPF